VWWARGSSLKVFGYLRSNQNGPGSSQVKSHSPGEHEGSAQRKPQGPARWTGLGIASYLSSSLCRQRYEATDQELLGIMHVSSNQLYSLFTRVYGRVGSNSFLLLKSPVSAPQGRGLGLLPALLTLVHRLGLFPPPGRGPAARRPGTCFLNSLAEGCCAQIRALGNRFIWYVTYLCLPPWRDIPLPPSLAGGGRLIVRLVERVEGWT
jgi:hypothetical protein